MPRQKTKEHPMCCEACRKAPAAQDNPEVLAPLFTLCAPCAEEVKEMFQLLERRENAPLPTPGLLGVVSV